MKSQDNSTLQGFYCGYSSSKIKLHYYTNLIEIAKTINNHFALKVLKLDAESILKLLP